MGNMAIMMFVAPHWATRTIIFDKDDSKILEISNQGLAALKGTASKESLSLLPEAGSIDVTEPILKVSKSWTIKNWGTTESLGQLAEQGPQEGTTFSDKLPELLIPLSRISMLWCDIDPDVSEAFRGALGLSATVSEEPVTDTGLTLLVTGSNRILAVEDKDLSIVKMCGTDWFKLESSTTIVNYTLKDIRRYGVPIDSYMYASSNMMIPCSGVLATDSVAKLLVDKEDGVKLLSQFRARIKEVRSKLNK